ncbi:hypothetical protein J2R96_008182 [Bradyrhizobium elkanii]|nr:hypothetical protein [Bradyrhizobium elkanii]
MSEIEDTIHKKDNPAGYARDRMVELINAFQAKMSDDVEVGISVVGSGSAASFRLRDVRASDPDIIIFDGLDDNGNDIQLIQHYTQMAVVLVARPKAEEKPYRIGFR